MDIVLVASQFIAGLIQKHLFSKLPNNAIPFINALLGTVAMYFIGPEATQGDLSTALTMGSTAAATSTGFHQALKLVIRWISTKVGSDNGNSV